jgi:ABC-type transport system involved in multi-copper enzyme maturation permease subunit
MPAAHRATFSHALRSERIKLTTVRSTWITLLVALAVGIGLGALISYLAGNHYASSGMAGRATWDPTAFSLDGIQLAELAVAVLGVLVISSEYGTGMIRVSLAAVPRRSRFLAAKAVVFTAVVLVAGEVMAFAAFLLGQTLIGSSAPHASFANPGVLRAVTGAGVYLAVIGLLALAIGTLVRRTAAGISAVMALLFVFPGLFGVLPSSWRNPLEEFWPTQAGTQIFILHPAAHTLAPWPGLAVLLLFTAAVMATASLALNRRDA